MKKYLILVLAAMFLVACGTGEDSEPVEKENEDEQQVEEVEKENDKKENPEKKESKTETLRELDQEELELWDNTDIPYLLEKHDIIESIVWSETEVVVGLKEKKVTGIVEDNLYDATNQIGKDIQEIVEWNYDVEEVPVTFYVDGEIVSKQNEHGVWTNFKMSNWEE